ncbi:hypothetical protein Dsin_031311 [Dipteronia sinensis]|uniref:DDE Tnp4 domain-containing protein n=1 Tax=Dipteronia sinensis TaxID=43782 RepID=A0AAE0DT92_9ROSI|nr:hypothetical protein Dsin_031311 [Dipteronia sinensis]
MRVSTYVYTSCITMFTSRKGMMLLVDRACPDYRKWQLQFVYYRMATRQIVVMDLYKLKRLWSLRATLIQSISHHTNGKKRLFAMKHEATRKDVEHAFGVLQSRLAITHDLVRFWKKNDLCTIMKTCIILHNMIMEDE